MRTPRIHTHQTLSPDSTLSLEEGPARHLIQVLRLKADAPVILFNGDGHDYQGVIISLGKRQVDIAISERGAQESAACLAIHLGLGISKGERMDFAIQKSVELGVTEITPLVSERCVVRISDERMQKRIQHWQNILIAACEQSGRRRLPMLHAPLKLQDWINKREAQQHNLLLDHRSSDTLASLSPPESGTCLLVGPEGGLSEEEIASAKREGFHGVQLGPRVLRTETAPLAAIAAMQALWGDFR
ncbi:MAG: 16S rRNA (uracil(1498)-N(3))-methyltransferase [Sedimenticola sp.]|nr:MAG: 16S rRNA (uracil(1498)-N(3))-methyltransferase [Sedimenticola sp.]